MERLSELIDKISEKAEQNHISEETDYIDPADGLLHCGKCHTPKQCRVTMLGRETTPYCVCECGNARIKAENEAFAQRQKATEISRLKVLSGINGKLLQYRFSEYRPNGGETLGICKKYAEHFDEMLAKNQGLLFWGGVGTGKTFSAACIANALLDRCIPVVMTSFVKLLGTNGGFEIGEDALHIIDRAKLLVIDDLGAERSTDFALEKVYGIIDRRYSSGLPMILTTNLDLSEMQRCSDIRYARVYERILEVCYPVRFNGTSLRKNEAGRRFCEMKKFFEE